MHLSQWMQRRMPIGLLRGRKLLLAAVAAVLITIGLCSMFTENSPLHWWGPNAWDKLSNAAGNQPVDDIPVCSSGLSKSRECSKALSKVPYFEMYNAVEDAKLRLYIGREKHKIKAVIYYLANSEGLGKLAESIALLYKNFNQQRRYPVVIFHEADFLPMAESVRHLGFIDKTKTSSIFFQQVNLGVPDWVLKKFGNLSETECGRDVGYRSMCRFQAKLIYEQTILRHFDYYWRLDDDSRIKYVIFYDVFEVLKTGGYSYGFYMANTDDCAGNLYNVTEDYMRLKRITPTFFHRLKRDEIFYNNFEVSSLKFWHSRQFRDFIEHIDSLGGIYQHRWGDAPIKTLALSMFVPLREIYHYRGILYEHPSQYKFASEFETLN